MVAHLHRHGASFLRRCTRQPAVDFPRRRVDAIWDLVWKGLAHQRHAARVARLSSSPPERTRRTGERARTFRSRRLIPPSAEGPLDGGPSARRIDHSVGDGDGAINCSSRHGIVTATSRSIEQLPGGFSAMYPVLRRFGGNRTHPPRLLRRRPRCRRSLRNRAPSICCATPARIADEVVDGDDLGHRSGESSYGVLIPAIRN